ncbi:MAG TPA: MCP four helix bundle domain-containing protein, partial [Duganella sp.]
MQWFYDLKIGKKLILAFAIVIALTCFLGLFSISQLVKVNQASTDIASNWMPAVRYLGQVQTSMSRYRISESTHILLGEDADMAATEKSMATRLETLGKQQASYAQLVSEPEEKRLYAEFQKSIEAYLVESKKLTALSRAGKKDEARVLFRGASNKVFRQVNEQLDGLAKINDEGSQASETSAAETFALARKLIIGTLVALIVISLVLATSVSRAVATPLQQAVEIARRVAEGDLTANIVSHGKDETGQLMLSL